MTSGAAVGRRGGRTVGRQEVDLRSDRGSGKEETERQMRPEALFRAD